MTPRHKVLAAESQITCNSFSRKPTEGGGLLIVADHSASTQLSRKLAVSQQVNLRWVECSEEFAAPFPGRSRQSCWQFARIPAGLIPRRLWRHIASGVIIVQEITKQGVYPLRSLKCDNSRHATLERNIMKLFARTPSRDPVRIHAALQQLSDELAEVLGADLDSIVLYGVFAGTNELETEHDSVNLMLVVRSASFQTLDKMKAAIARAEQQIPLTTMTLTREELHASCDVFPIKFHEMQQNHDVLKGEDVLSGLEISDDHLRLRCEQQLKNLMLRLRASYLHRNHDLRQLRETLLEANRNLLQDIRACLFVKTGIVPEADADLAADFSSEFDLDTKVIHDILDLRGRADESSADDLKQTFGRFMQLVHDSALAVDKMETR